MEPTPTQLDIIKEDGNTVVLASPGSGKTYVMSEKIKRILGGDEMQDYQGVIAISYTRKASNHLKQKSLSNGIWEKNSFFGTIDSFCLTQIILPFGNFVFGYPITEVLPITIDELADEKRTGFNWIKEDHPDYDTIDESLWQNLYALYQEGNVLINSLELLALQIIKKSAACRLHLRARFKYVFIDEFQDADTYTNDILKELVGLGLRGNVVGDVNQSIFGFDHKKSEYLEALQVEPGFKAFKLTDNHRSSVPIINYSNRLLDENSVIIKNKEEGMELISVDGDEVKVAEYLTNYIGEDCKKWGISDMSQVAILVKNSRTQTYIDDNLDIPHRVVFSTPLDDDVNPRSRLYGQLLQYYFDDSISFMSIIDNYVDYDMFTSGKRKILQKLKKEIKAVNEGDIANKFPELFKEVANILLEKYQEGSALLHLDCVLASERLTGSYHPLKENEVVIMTLHKAKGLEFDIVYHLNMNVWELPFQKVNNRDFEHPQYPSKKQDLDLHYVGVTRAKKLCVLITSSQRHNDKGELKRSGPSIFLNINGLEKMRKNYTY